MPRITWRDAALADFHAHTLTLCGEGIDLAEQDYASAWAQPVGSQSGGATGKAQKLYWRNLTGGVPAMFSRAIEERVRDGDAISIRFPTTDGGPVRDWQVVVTFAAAAAPASSGGQAGPAALVSCRSVNERLDHLTRPYTTTPWRHLELDAIEGSVLAKVMAVALGAAPGTMPEIRQLPGGLQGRGPIG